MCLVAQFIIDNYVDSLSFALTPSMKIYNNSYRQHNTSNDKRVSRGQIYLNFLSWTSIGHVLFFLLIAEH